MGQNHPAEGPLRLAFIDDRFHQVYGAQRNLLLLATQASESGHDVAVYTTAEGALAAEARELGLSAVVVEAPDELRRFERASFAAGPLGATRTASAAVRYEVALARRLRSDRRQIVVAAALRSALLVGLWRVGRSGKVVLYAQNDIPYGIPAALAGVVSDRIGLIGADCEQTFPAWSRTLLRRRFRPLASGRDLTRFGVGRDRSPRLPGDRFELLSAGAISRRKGYFRLIDAIADAGLADRVRLTILGSADDESGERHLVELEQQAERRSVEVVFAGWQDDVVPFLREADAFALASSHEGLPGVLLEAMAAGLPCVTTDAGNAGDLVRDCEGGTVVGIDDAEGLAAAVHSLVDDPTAARAIGARAAEHVARRYGLDGFNARFEAILAELRG